MTNHTPPSPAMEAPAASSYPPMPEHRIGQLADRLREATTIEDQFAVLREQASLLEAIITLSTMPYRQYLKSEWWKSCRERALAHFSHRCAVCDSPDNLDVHHRTYERRGMEPLGDLTVLCRECHTIFHENGKLATA